MNAVTCAMATPEARGGEGVDALATVTNEEAARVRLVLPAPTVTQDHERTSQIRLGMTARPFSGSCR